MKIIQPLIFALIMSVGFAPDVSAQVHRGRVDTDGILSPGEIPNPRINYGSNYDRRYLYRNDHDRRHHDNHRYHDHKGYWDRDRFGQEFAWRDNDHRGGAPWFSDALSRGIKAGRISRREEQELRWSYEELSRRADQYRRGGLSRWEREDLENRESALRKKLEHELNDGEKRW